MQRPGSLLEALLLALLLALPQALAAQALPSLGPLRLGMGLDEVRAATPGAAWQPEAVSPHSGRAYRLRSRPPLDLHGLPLEVEVHARHHEQALRARAALRTGSADACERRLLDWLTAAEPGLGPFAGRTPQPQPPQGGGLQWNSQRGAGGGVVLMPSARPGTPGRSDGETHPLNARSNVLVEAFDEEDRPRARRALLSGEPARLRLSASGRGPGHELALEADYRAAPQGPDCSLSVRLDRLLIPALPQRFDAAAHPLREAPSVALRHLAYGGTEPPRAPLDVTLRCDVVRASGVPRSCVAVGERQPPGLEEVAARLAHAMRFELRGVDRDDPVPLRGPVRLRLAPEDRRPMDFAGAPRTPWAALDWRAQPSPQDLRLFKPPAQRDGDGPVAVPLLCRVEADGSLLCQPDGGAPPPRPAAAEAAVWLAAATYRAAPRLRDGTPSTGRVLALTVVFDGGPDDETEAEAEAAR